jgi:hypothetical protein
MAYFNQVAISQDRVGLRSLGQGLGAFRGWLQPVQSRKEAATAPEASGPPGDHPA